MATARDRDGGRFDLGDDSRATDTTLPHGTVVVVLAIRFASLHPVTIGRTGRELSSGLTALGEGEGWRMSRWYRFMYKVGFTPWESETDTWWPQLRRLIELEEADRSVPYGRALDLGCGKGRWSIELAKRAWQVVGIDVIAQAVDAARQRAQEAGVDAEFVVGDVVALRAAGIRPSFTLFLDVECFNHLSDAQRIVVGHEVDALAEPDATMLMLGWRRASRGPLPPGVEADDLASAFPGWEIVRQEPYEGEMPRLLRGATPQWYRLKRMR